jgi:hypothetical protein
MTKPAVAYGASGYTRRLICEYRRGAHRPGVLRNLGYQLKPDVTPHG